MPLSHLPGPWRWEERQGKWWRIHDAQGIEDGPHDAPYEYWKHPALPVELHRRPVPEQLRLWADWLIEGKDPTTAALGLEVIADQLERQDLPLPPVDFYDQDEEL